MALDARLWQELEAHGVTTAHLDLLLQVLRAEKNGSVAWHFVHGALTGCDVRLSFPSRTYDLNHVAQCLLLDGEHG